MEVEAGGPSQPSPAVQEAGWGLLWESRRMLSRSCGQRALSLSPGLLGYRITEPSELRAGHSLNSDSALGALRMPSLSSCFQPLSQYYLPGAWQRNLLCGPGTNSGHWVVEELIGTIKHCILGTVVFDELLCFGEAGNLGCNSSYLASLAA